MSSSVYFFVAIVSLTTFFSIYAGIFKSLFARKHVAKPRTWRVTQIPISVTEEKLRAQFEDFVNTKGAPKTKILQLSLAPSTRGYACATITLQCSLPKTTKEGYRIEVTFLGITPLYEGKDASVDLIAVPGLGSHALGSFKSSSSFDVWLRDFLPKDIPNIRVLLYGYDTKLAESDSKSSIRDLSKSFLESMRAFRAGTGVDRRPIIFIAHSLALANDDREDRQSLNLSLASCGLLFFGVPNLGLRNSQLETMVVGQPNARFVRDLIVDNESEPSSYLKELSRKFIKCSMVQDPKYQIVSYYERRASRTVEASQLSTIYHLEF